MKTTKDFPEINSSVQNDVYQYPNPIRYSKFKIRYSLFKIRYSLFIIHYSIFLFLLLFPSSLPAQEWTEPVNISNLGGFCIDPDMVIDHSGVIHVVLSYGIDYWYRKIMYTSSTDFGETWTVPLDLLQNTDLWMSQPHIDCDSKNHLYVTYDYATGTQDKMVYLIVYDGHQWSDPILVSEGMPGSDYNKVVLDNDDRVFVFWAYGSQFMYYRYLENEAWSDFYCPYCDSVDIFAFADGHSLSGNLLHWIGASASFNYYGERLQYYLFDIKNNSWSIPQMLVQDTIKVGKDIALNNDGVPVCVYRNKPSGTDRTKFIQKDGNYWSYPELVACQNGFQRYQRIEVDQNNDVHIVELEEINDGYRMVHYQKINEGWYGYTIDSTPNFCNPTKLLFYCNSLLLVYYRDSIPGAPDDDIYFTKYDVITGKAEQCLRLPDLKIYPNPGSENIYIEFENNKEQHIDLSVFDINGKHIITLIGETKPQGLYRQLWNGTDKHRKEVSPGLYLVRLKSGRKTVTCTLEVLK